MTFLRTHIEGSEAGFVLISVNRCDVVLVSQVLTTRARHPHDSTSKSVHYHASSDVLPIGSSPRRLSWSGQTMSSLINLVVFLDTLTRLIRR